jgi:hypothetical protein
LFSQPYELPFELPPQMQTTLSWCEPKKESTYLVAMYIAFLLPLQRKKGKSYVLDDNFMMCKLGDGAMCELHDDAMVVLHLKRWWTNSANQGV